MGKATKSIQIDFSKLFKTRRKSYRLRVEFPYIQLNSVYITRVKMHQLLRLIASAQKHGIITGYKDDSGKPRTLVVRSGPLWEGFLRALENCQPFVFSDNGKPQVLQESAYQEESLGHAKDELDAPFPVFSIEKLNGVLSVFDTADLAEHSSECILVIEISPTEYAYFTLTSQDRVWASNSEGKVIAHYLDRLKKERMGNESVRIKVQLGEGKSKRRHEIRRIIHVAPKVRVVQLESTKEGKKIDWSHRFEVRGHWVSLPGGLGKDRAGNYCVKGFTWRSHHVRGDESLPLIKKVRVMKEETT